LKEISFGENLHLRLSVNYEPLKFNTPFTGLRIQRSGNRGDSFFERFADQPRLSPRKRANRVLF